MGRADVQVKKIVLKITGVFTDRELRNNYWSKIMLSHSVSRWNVSCRGKSSSRKAKQNEIRHKDYHGCHVFLVLDGKTHGVFQWKSPPNSLSMTCADVLDCRRKTFSLLVDVRRLRKVWTQHAETDYKMGDHVFTPHSLNDFYQLKGICFIEQKRVRLEIN